MDYREYTARSVDDAITQACMDFGVTSDRLDYRKQQADFWGSVQNMRSSKPVCV